MNLFKLLLVFGTRPEGIKMAPVYSKLKERNDTFDVKVLITAQHREMLDQVLKLFSIIPDFDLNVMTKGQTLTDLATRILPGIESVLMELKPNLVMVHGDTSTTFLASLAAYYQKTPVAHVEAGLRTYNKYSPFPEEMNRRLTGVLADLHFAPTAKAKQNLILEGVREEKIFVTGNTVIDALMETINSTKDQAPPGLRCIPENRRIILVTTHRRENLGEPLRQVYVALRKIVEEFPDVEVIFPVHPNPAVRKPVWEELGDLERVHLWDPLEYGPFVQTLNRSYLVLTDSGGIQEEAPALGKPVLVLRNTTERPEAIEAGTVKLIDTHFDIVYHETKRLLESRDDYMAMASAVNPYGDGFASERILEYLLFKYGHRKKRPNEFDLMSKERC